MAEIEIPKKNIDLEKLGLINQGLFEVNGQLAEKYNQILKEVFDFECDLDSFRIDKRGLSPEIGSYLKSKYPDKLEFGENYLNMRSANRFMVVVSPDQKNSPLIAPQASYDDEIFDLVHNHARHTIEDITQSEVLFGELENRISFYRTADDLLQMRTIDISLDTLNETVRNILVLRKMSDDLDNEENALDDNYIKKMQNLVKVVGDVRYRTVSEIFPIKKEIHCFYVEFFKGVHCLRNFRNSDSVKAIFIYHHQNLEKDLDEEIVAHELHDPELLETLHKYRFLKYNEKLIEKRIQEIEDEVLLADNIDVVDLNPYRRKKLVIEHAPKFPESWHELRDI